MKKLLMLCLSAVMLAAASCSALDKLGDRIKKEQNSFKDFEKKAMKALAENDRELLKSCFSQKALERASDFDKGLDYVFDLYRDGKGRVVDDNSKSYSYYERDRKYKVVHAWCKFNAGENSYKMVWTQWLEDSGDPSMVGVYSFDLIEITGNEEYLFWDVAGIGYPERYCVHQTFSELTGSDTGAADVFSDELMENAVPVEKKYMLRVIDYIGSNDVGTLWVDDSKGCLDTYAEIRYDLHDYIMCLRSDGEKITAASLADSAENIIIKDNEINGFAEMLAD
ncbi:DUF5104 domain-containing protein [uncultured Ruminococcus sp.]|uniref:DUF5104 domain-containing protein n=1 Tax=uncultured Ruminococcus sp. TaxID=165186 RepID=UPI00261F37E7|nr:DUF5104 domain-containing protein [uncultured Ruminococcus sp.]